MTSEKTLQKLGTISLGEDFMRQTIGFGKVMMDPTTGEGYIDPNVDPEILQLGLWLAFVPKVFLPGLNKHLLNIGEKYLENQTVTGNTITHFIANVQQAIYLDVSNGKLTSDGWRE